MSVRTKVLLLIGSNQHHFSTAKMLIDKKLNIVGIVVANKKSAGIDFNFLKTNLRKHGIIKVILQVIERVVYKLLNSRKDKEIYNKLFPINDKEAVLNRFGSNELIFVSDYDQPEVTELLQKQGPDLIIIHTPYWVSKKIRSLVNGKVLGGHPGITQKYRGIHSPFWAIYNGDNKNIGYTVFWVTNGVDAGDIIDQGFINPHLNDSYVSLSWRGMKEITSSIGDIVLKHENIDDIKSIKNDFISSNTLFYHPTILNYISYRLKNNIR